MTKPTSSRLTGADDYLANIVEGRCADAESILRMVVLARADVRRLEEQLEATQAALRWFTEDAAWTLHYADGRLTFHSPPGSIYATPWGVARAALNPATSFPGGVAQPSASATVGQSAGLESQRTEKAESAPPAGESHPAKKFTPAEIGHMQDAIDQHNPGNYERRTASPPAKAPLTEAAEGSGLTSGNWAKEPHNCPEDCQGIHDAFDANDWD